MFAALLLLSAAGIGIYTLLAPASHLALRRRHEIALGKDNGWLRVFRRKRLIC
jgi:NitT/TauT family transport system permease protein